MTKLFYSRFRRNLIVLVSGAVLLILIVSAIAVVELLQMRTDAEITVNTSSSNLAKSMTFMFDGMIETIDIALFDSQDEFNEEMLSGRINAGKFSGYLARQQKHLAALPYVRATNEQGDIFYGQGIAAPYSNISDRDFFIKQRDNPDLGLFVGKPIVSRISKKWVWPFSRRLNKPDGSFAGVVYASIYIDQITKILSEIKLSKGEVIGLRHADLASIAGRIESSSTFPIKIGDNIVSVPFTESLKRNPMGGTYVSDSTKLDNLSHTFSYNRSQKYGFLVNVGTTGNAILEEWHKQLWTAGSVLLTIILIIAVITYLIGHSWQVQERDLSALNEAHDLAHFGNYTIDLKSYRLSISSGLERILGVNSGQLKLLDDLLRLIKLPQDIDLRGYLEMAVKQNTPVDQEFQISRPVDGMARWLHIKGKFHVDLHGKPNALIGTMQDITERKLAELEIEHLAYFDMLTGLPNRRLLYDRLTHALATGARKQQHGALLLLDLDNFKSVNDIRGHHVGDMLLQEVAARLVANVRMGDTVARLGGDEFIVMLEGLSFIASEAGHQVETVGKKILQALNRPYQLAGNEHHNTPSIGAILFSENDQTADELIKRADTAMYEAKTAGRNTIKFFDPVMQRTVEAQFQVENDLRSAIAQKQFELHYQPQVDADNKVVGVEALIRWNHPQQGLVSPGYFIPVAENCGLILPIGQWVLEEACQQLAVWARQPDTAHLTMAVNVSALQFSLRNFVDEVLDILKHSGARANLLKLELTEGLLLKNAEDVIVKMSTLKNRGVSFSLDDFGTGYSSLSYLKRLPLDQLKIDQSFIRDVLTDMNDAAIAKTVIALGHSLGLEVIAEGVEASAQHDFLLHAGCRFYQGYYFSKPLPIGDFELFLRNGLKPV